MKLIKNIYPDIYSFENLYQAYIEARKNKLYRDEVLEFSMNLEENLIDIQNELIWHTYKVGKYRQFYVREPKKRLVMALPFRDRVVQWAIYRQLNPIFDPQYIEHTYACRKKKGREAAADQLEYWVHQVDRKAERWYYLKLDISKYFYRIDHELAMLMFERHIADPDLLWLLGLIINCEDTPFGLPIGMDVDQCPEEDRLFNVGMPIGSLTSQMIAGMYLSTIDHLAKHDLRMHYYIRYMDDIIILAPDKEYLHYCKEQIEQVLNNQLRLQLNNKTAIRPVSKGIEFVGYKIYPTHRKMKKQTVRKMKKRIAYMQDRFEQGEADFKEVNATMQSYFGLMQHFDSYGLRKNISENMIFRRKTD